MALSSNSSTSEYWVDLEDERLWRGDTQVHLTPKAFAMLRYFLGHPNRLLTKRALLKALWPGITVTESEVKHFVHELRQGLADDPKHPTFIQTVHSRGYRYIGDIRVSGCPDVVAAPGPTGLDDVAPILHLPDHTIDFFGREAELAALAACLQRVRRGERVIALVSGEAGIGKTALVASFLRQSANAPGDLIGIGQCVEQYGAVEPFMPVLDALEGLCRQPDGQVAAQHLARFAPSWVSQMPGVFANHKPPDGSTASAVGSFERMLRELVQALEMPISKGVLIILLEDLHWADPSTLDLLGSLARRRLPARLLVIGTYRPEDDHGLDYSLRQQAAELAVRGLCKYLPVGPLDEATVAAYVRSRLPKSSDAIEQAVYRHTEGNPLFMVNMVAHLLAQDRSLSIQEGLTPTRTTQVIELGIPDSLRDLIESQLDGLADEDRRLLEACSVGGSRFSAETVAAALGQDPADMEERCESLCRRGRFLRRCTAPDGSDATTQRQYEFRHALYLDILYKRVSPERRANFHHAIGLQLERRFDPDNPELAAVLALHFERGRDFVRAVRYLKHAADIALRRCANAEAIQLLTKAIEVVRRLPRTSERLQEELALRVSLGAPIAASKSWAAPEMEQTYGRARSLCEEIGDVPQLFPILWGIWAFNVLRARHEAARELSEELIGLARRSQDSGFLLEGHVAMGLTHAWRGEFTQALPHLDKGLDGYDPLSHRGHSFEYGQDPRMICLAHKSWLRWWLGYPEQAVAAAQDAISWAHEVSHPHSLAFATVYAAALHLFRGEYRTVLELTDDAIRLSNEHAFGQWSIFANIFRGRALVAQGEIEGGIARLERGLSEHRETGSEWGQPFFLTLLAEAYGKGTQEQKSKEPLLLDEALALIDTTKERFYEAEVHRVRGEYMAMVGRYDEAKGCFRRAFDIAGGQSAKSWQLRAASSLGRLLQKQSRDDDARKSILPVYSWFTEGLSTKDLNEAKSLLKKVS
jgi:predicted ATPase/DNA-binding winged helix-turn-helix (wHTH) protein